MKLKWMVNFMIVLIISGIALFGLAKRDAFGASGINSDKIDSSLLDQIAVNGSADFIIRFNDQPDLSPAYSMDWEARGEFVYNTLRETATNSQANAKRMLDKSGLKYHTFINGNELYVWGGTLTDATELAAFPEIISIQATRTYSIDPFIATSSLASVTWAGDFLSQNLLTTVTSTVQATKDWGILDTKADQFWTTFGAKGDGIVVANIDTGVQWNHPALVNQFKCPGQPNNPNCWSDPTNICGPGGACDKDNLGRILGHGTHTMGTMVGDDDSSLPYIVGMAPDAQWIACKGCESDNCTAYALGACADWILAPNGDPNNRPDVVNNSWGGGGGDDWYQNKVIAWRAAGIFPAFSAGNSGESGCSTLSSPGDYQQSLGSAAHDSSRNIASFSSRGPSAFGHEPYTKPNISAPGVGIISSFPTNSWASGGGTSMASPHSAGAVALLWSCNPSLVGQVDATFQLLQNNANAAPAGNCGAPPDAQGNYTYGYGYLDMLQAGLMTCGVTQTGTLDGYVHDQQDNPIQGAAVNAVPTVQGNEIQVFTDPTGYYTMNIPVGTYNVTASKINYQSQTVNGVQVLDGQITHQNFVLNKLESWTQISLPAGCPDWTRFDGEYYAPTGKVYFLGGRDGDVTYGDIYSYNPISNTCADTNINIPTPVSNYTIALVNNGIADLLCIFGGRPAGGGVTSEVQCYNPVANSAALVSYLPGNLANYVPGGVSVVNSKVLVFGGFRSSPAPYETNATYEWNPAANQWAPKGSLPLAMGYIQTATVNGKVYAFGGTISNGVTLTAQVKTAVYDPALGLWNDAAVAELPVPGAEGRAYGYDTGSGYALAGKIIIAGGGQFPNETNSVFSYDVRSNTYDYNFPDLNVSRRDQAGFFIPGDPATMWVFGGRSGTDAPPYAPPEYYQINGAKYLFLPLVKNLTR